MKVEVMAEDSERGGSAPPPDICPRWLTALLASASTALLGGVFLAMRDSMRPVCRVLLESLSRNTLLTISAALALSLTGMIIIALRLWSWCRSPLSERYRFDPARGFHTDKGGRPLCPLCLNGGRFTRVRFASPGAGYCPEHGAVVGPVEG